MKVEIHATGPNTLAWLQSVLGSYAAAAEADRDALDARWNERFNTPAQTADGEPATVQAPAAEPEKPKRTRKAKEDAPVSPTVELESAAQITTSPEDRKPVEEIEEAEVVDVFEEAAPAKVYTRDDVKAAMQTYVAKHGMDKLAANAADLLGAPKLSSIPEDAAAFEAAVKRLEAAVA